MKRWVQIAVVSILLIATANIGVLNYQTMNQRREMSRIAGVSQLCDQVLYQGVKEAHLRIQEAGTPDFRDLIQEKMPSVVSIHGEHKSIVDPTGRPARMSGSGVVVGKDGAILTCAHVVDSKFVDCKRVWVVFSDGTEREVERFAYVEGRDPDVAVIWVDPNGLDLQPVDIVEPTVWYGQRVVALGTPRGIRHAASGGIVSIPRREINDVNNNVRPFIQIDAPIVKGNSGGPVFNKSGQFLGIATWIKDYGMGYITPVDRILEGLQKMCEPIDVVLAEPEVMEEAPPIFIFRF